MGKYRNMQQQKQAEARQNLKQYIKPSSEILIVIKSVSASGMSRRMRVLTSDFSDISYYVSDLLDLSINENGLLVTGCGMDMTFWLANAITRAMKWENKKSFRGNGRSCIAWKSI